MYAGYQGSVYYTVPAAQPTGSYKIRIRGTGGSPTDDSDNAFTITTKPATNTGSLVFKTNPTGASIYLDGSTTSSGTTATALTVSNLVQGDHRVKVTRSGYYDRSYKVTVIAGQTYTCPTWPLELVPTSGANADFSPFGGMDIRTDPEGADIWIDKTDDAVPAANQGLAPALLYLEPGDYEVYLTKDGYQQSATQTVKVERLYPEREPVRVEFTLTPLSPTFTSISPSFGPTTGSTAVTITGTNFVDGGSLSVTIGGVAATEVSVIDSTGLQQPLPPAQLDPRTSWLPTGMARPQPGLAYIHMRFPQPRHPR